MSHVFISYSRNDRDKLERLVEKLKVSGLSENEIWYDKHMKAGDDWRDEIEVKLKEAYAVVVIVTKEAMDSTYVTYEWSWALGNGTPVCPLLFEDLPTTQIHARLSKINYRNCIHDINDDVPETLKGYNQLLPDVEYLYRLITDTVMPFRVLARVLLWLYPYRESSLVDSGFFKKLIEQTMHEAGALSTRKLPELMIGKAYALTSKQAKMCRRIIEGSVLFWKTFHYESIPGVVGNLLKGKLGSELINEAETYRVEKIEPTISFFEVFEIEENTMIEDYRVFDHYLTTISTGSMAQFGVFYRGNLRQIPYHILESAIGDAEIANRLIDTIQKICANTMSQTSKEEQ